MKKIIIILLVFVLYNSTLFAISNKYLSLSESGWKVMKESDKAYNFVLEDFTIEDENQSGIIPNFSLVIHDNDGLCVAKYDQKELNQFVNAFKNKGFQEYMKAAKDATKEVLKKNYKSATRKQISSLVDKIFEESHSGIVSSKIGKLGNNKAYIIDFKIGKAIGRRYMIISLNYNYVFEFRCDETTDLDSLSSFKSFTKSLNIKDSAPTSFNAFLHGSLLKHLTRLIILIVAAIIGNFFRKNR